MSATTTKWSWENTAWRRSRRAPRLWGQPQSSATRATTSYSAGNSERLPPTPSYSTRKVTTTKRKKPLKAQCVRHIDTQTIEKHADILLLFYCHNQSYYIHSYLFYFIFFTVMTSPWSNCPHPSPSLTPSWPPASLSRASLFRMGSAAMSQAGVDSPVSEFHHGAF